MPLAMFRSNLNFRGTRGAIRFHSAGFENNFAIRQSARTHVISIRVGYVGDRAVSFRGRECVYEIAQDSFCAPESEFI